MCHSWISSNSNSESEPASCSLATERDSLFDIIEALDKDKVLFLGSFSDDEWLCIGILEREVDFGRESDSTFRGNRAGNGNSCPATDCSALVAVASDIVVESFSISVEGAKGDCFLLIVLIEPRTWSRLLRPAISLPVLLFFLAKLDNSPKFILFLFSNVYVIKLPSKLIDWITVAKGSSTTLITFGWIRLGISSNPLLTQG